MSNTPLTPPSDDSQSGNGYPAPMGPASYSNGPAGAGYQYPGASGQQPLPAGLQYNAAGGIKRPAPWLTALIILIVAMALAALGLAALPAILAAAGSTVVIPGGVTAVIVIGVASLAINLIALIAMWRGFGWGRIVYAAMFAIGLVLNIATGSFQVSQLLPVIVIVLLFMPQSTAYLQEMAKRR